MIVVRTETHADDVDDKEADEGEGVEKLPEVKPPKPEPAATHLASLPVAETPSETKPTPAPVHDGDIISGKVDEIGKVSSEKKPEGKSEVATPATLSSSVPTAAVDAPPITTSPAPESISPAVSKNPKPKNRKKSKPAATETKLSVPAPSSGWIERQVSAVKVLLERCCAC